MKSEDAIVVHGDPDQVYALASAVERWPEILPHYRKVEILRDHGNGHREVTMRCVRAFGPFAWPCAWRAEQWSDPETRRIRFRHLAGPAKGMDVEWRIDPVRGGTRASIDHDFQVSIPLLGWVYSDAIVGRLFVRAVAGRTLATIKRLVEEGRG